VNMVYLKDLRASESLCASRESEVLLMIE